MKNPDPGQKSHIELDINRTGTQSIYGDFRVTYIDENGQAVVVGNVKGVAVYTPNTLRHFQIPVNAPAFNNVYSKGRFHITYSESGKSDEAGLIAKIDLKL
jgi:hypothetical protein